MILSRDQVAHFGLWATIRSFTVAVHPFRWRLVPDFERCVCDSAFRWLCISVHWDNP